MLVVFLIIFSKRSMLITNESLLDFLLLDVESKRVRNVCIPQAAVVHQHMMKHMSISSYMLRTTMRLTHHCLRNVFCTVCATPITAPYTAM